MHKERFKLISAVHLFLIRDGKILLLRRFNTGYQDGNYSVPAGHLDGGESVTTAMIREAKEEVVIDIEWKNLQVVNTMHRLADDGERIDFFFTTKTYLGNPQIGEPDKCDDLSWFDINKLPENMVPYVKSAIESYKQKVIFSEFGWN